MGGNPFAPLPEDLDPLVVCMHCVRRLTRLWFACIVTVVHIIVVERLVVHWMHLHRLACSSSMLCSDVRDTLVRSDVDDEGDDFIDDRICACDCAAIEPSTDLVSSYTVVGRHHSKGPGAAVARVSIPAQAMIIDRYATVD